MANEVMLYNLNADGGYVSDELAGFVKRRFLPRMMFGQKGIYGLTVLTNEGNPYNFNIDDIFEFATDDDLDSATDIAMKTNDIDINVPGDWVDLDVTGGKISVPADTFTTEVLAILDAAPDDTDVDFFADIKVTRFGELQPYVVIRWLIRIGQVVDPSGTIPTNAPGDYSNAMIDSLIGTRQSKLFRDNEAAAIDVKSTGSTVLHTQPADTVGMMQGLVFINEDFGGAVTSDFDFDLGISGDTNKYLADETADITNDGDTDSYVLNGFTKIPAGETVEIDIKVARVATGVHTVKVIPKILDIDI